MALSISVEERIAASIWSAEFHAMNGQALVTRFVVDELHQITWRKYIYKLTSLGALTSWLANITTLWIDVWFGRTKVLYLVCSRSKMGFIRDVPALLSAFFGVRVIVHAHGSDIVDLLGSSSFSSFAQAMYRCCELVVPSAHLVKPLAHVKLKALHVCENFCMPMPPLTGFVPGDNKLHILWNSNILASKGFFDVAEAVSTLHGSGMNASLLAIGEPLGDSSMSRTEAKHQLESLEGKPWFSYLGRVSQGESIELLSRCELVCLPSSYASECQPLAIIQAMCAGKAILIADSAALLATVDDYPCHVARAGDVLKISEILSGMALCSSDELQDHATRLRASAKNARGRFSVDLFRQRFLAIMKGENPNAGLS
jgi:glycosyltransferase involved in cell wall biosynthesis